MEQPSETEALWRAILTGAHPSVRKGRHLHRLIPSNPRCKFCNAPFGGFGAFFMRLKGKGPSTMSPRICNLCEQFARTHPGGAEIELTMLFADVRGSTALAERMSSAEFSRLMNRFYSVASSVLINSDAMIDKLVGDEAIGIYLPGWAGPDHARLAVQAARDLLTATGHRERTGPWVPVGVGVHTGRAFVGAVGSEGVTDLTALGDAVNITARLASQAGPGEILVSQASAAEAKMTTDGLESRRLDLKGRTVPVDVWALRMMPS